MKIELVRDGGEVYLRVLDATLSEFYGFLSKLLASSMRQAYYHSYERHSDRKILVHFKSSPENLSYIERQLNNFLNDNGFSK
jgi:hypothetical protein